MGGFFSFYHSFSYPYEKLLKSDKVKSNTECFIQSSRDSSQEIDGPMSPTYITSTLLPVQTWRPCNTILLQTHFLKICILFKKISFGLWLAQSLFSVHLNFLYFFLQVLFFLSSFLLQSLIFISPTQEPFRHSFIYKFQLSGRCPKQTLSLDVPPQRPQSDAGWYMRPESKAEVIHKPPNCLLKQRT